MAESIRRALRSYHCYACEREFREMVDLNNPSSVRCPNCESDFLEEKKSFDQDQQPRPQAQQPSQPQAQPQPQPQPRPQMRPQMQPQMRPGAAQVPHQMPSQEQGAHPMRQQQFVQMHAFGGPQRQQQTVTRTMNPDGSWTQSVTISFGNNQPNVQQSHNIHGAHQQPQQQHQQMPNEFASAAHAHQQMPNQHHHSHQEMPHQPRQPQQQHPFAEMGQIFGGNFMGQMGGPIGPHPRQAQNPPGHPADFLGQMFGGMGGFFQGAFPEGFQFGEGDRPRSRGCSEDFIANLPDKEAGKESDCYICLEKCKEGKLACTLPCGHAFDRDCIKNWLNEHDSCPVCRKKLENTRPQADPQQQQNQQQNQNNPMGFFF